MSACAGHCCRIFYLPHTPAELEAKRGDLVDGETICDMVIYRGLLTADQYEGYCRQHGLAPDKHVLIKRTTGNYYTCKCLTVDGLCSIYETRPHMCRDFPYGHPCQYGDCEHGPIYSKPSPIGAALKRLKDVCGDGKKITL